MATYYPSSSNHRDAIPALYLRNPPPASYQEAPVLPGNMMMYLNYPSSAGSYSDTLSVNPQPQQNGAEIPPVGTSESSATGHQGILSNLAGASHIGEPNYSVWRDDLGHSSLTDDLQMDMRTQLGILHGSQNLQGQGLSLSLSTQIPSAISVPSFQYRDPNSGLLSFLSSHPSFSDEGGGRTGSSRGDERSQNKQPRNVEYMHPGFPGGNHESVKGEALNNLQSPLGPKPMHSDTSYGLLNLTSAAVPNSKYLKAAQQLLDEVVNVRKALKQPESEKHQSLQGFGLKDSKEAADRGLKGGEMPSNPESTTNSCTELSPTERQDLQNKLTKLLSMLDEVDRRYKQYYHQMQIVVSSFDVIAGCGAAKPYTALALQTISRHFRCLRDAISDQIHAIRINLGEQDTSASSKGGGISRLRFVDQQLRQQRALQQLGMMQHHAWRPQRGLPENSVSILRAWLFEHFLHPYPKDSEKIMLARQTGLTRSQVSNWFINARVRLWKPMVEEMYKEEIGDTEMDSNSSSDNAPKPVRDDVEASQEKETELPQSETPVSTERFQLAQLHDSKSNFIPDIEMAGSTSEAAGFQDGANADDPADYGILKLRGDERPGTDDCILFQDALVQSDGSGNGRFMTAANAYQMSELGRFGSGSGVSLTLGLQHCDNGGLTMSGGTHHNFITMRGDEMYNAAASSVGPDTSDYDCMDPGTRRHRFATSHLLHDFVA